MLLKDLLHKYINDRHIMPATRRAYSTALDVFQRDTGIQYIEKVTRQLVIDWRHKVIERGCTTHTWNNYFRHMRALVRYAQRHSIISSQHDDPLLDIHTITTYQHIPKTTNTKEFQRALQIINSEPVEPTQIWTTMLLMFWTTGIRKRQAINLECSDIDFDNRKITLRAETSKTHRAWKTGLPKALEQRLRELVNNSQTGQLFDLSPYNHPYKTNTMDEGKVTSLFRRFKRRDLNISPHRLRHSFATNFAKNGQLKLLQHALGHTNLQTTMIYITPDIDELTTRIDQLEIPFF